MRLRREIPVAAMSAASLSRLSSGFRRPPIGRFPKSAYETLIAPLWQVNYK
jgi:hypothetical protein